MNKKEIQAKVRELLVAGTPKAQVFEQLAGQGAKDSQLAYFIASYADPHRCSDHERKVNVLVTIMFIQALIAFFMGFGIMMTPGLAVDGRVKVSGKVPDVAEIKKLLA